MASHNIKPVPKSQESVMTNSLEEYLIQKQNAEASGSDDHGILCKLCGLKYQSQSQLKQHLTGAHSASLVLQSYGNMSMKCGNESLAPHVNNNNAQPIFVKGVVPTNKFKGPVIKRQDYIVVNGIKKQRLFLTTSSSPKIGPTMAKERSLLCTYCSRNFKYLSALLSHEMICTFKADKEKSGQICQKPSLLMPTVNMDLRRNYYKCANCNMTSNSLDQHQDNEKQCYTGVGSKGFTKNEQTFTAATSSQGIIINMSPIENNLSLDSDSSKWHDSSDIKAVECHSEFAQPNFNSFLNVECDNNSTETDIKPGVIVIKPEFTEEVKDETVHVKEEPINSSQDAKIKEIVTEEPHIIVVKPQEELDAKNWMLKFSTSSDQHNNSNNQTRVIQENNCKRGEDMKSCQAPVTDWRCVTCERYFFSKAALKIHMSITQGACTSTKKTIKVQPSKVLKADISEQLLNKSKNDAGGQTNGKSCTCLICLQRFYNKSALSYHIDITHPDISYSNRYAMLQNAQVGSDSIMYKCSECKIPCASAVGLKNHMRLKHNKLPIPICDKHVKIRPASDKGKNWKCLVCDKSYFTKVELDKHPLEKKSWDRQIFTCTICRKHYSTVTVLSIHINKSHPDLVDSFHKPKTTVVESTQQSDMERNGFELYKCTHSKCKLVFVDKTALNCHIHLAHPELHLEISDRVQKCDQ